MSKVDDKHLGNLGEIDVIKKLLLRNKNLYKYRDEFSIMDFFELKDNNLVCEYELKTRRIKHDKYGSLMMGKNKFEYSIEAIKKGIRQIYLWNCSDGLYMWELKDVEEQAEEYCYGTGGNYARGDKSRDVVYISIKYIKPFIGGSVPL